MNRHKHVWFHAGGWLSKEDQYCSICLVGRTVKEKRDMTRCFYNWVEETDCGFRWGPMEVSRVQTTKTRGILIETEKSLLEIRVSSTGLIKCKKKSCK